MAKQFLDEVRYDIERAAADGCDTQPRLRSVHEKVGHATPEYRTIGITIPPEVNGASPEILAGAVARYAAAKAPERLMLAMDATMQGDDGATRPVLIAEARDQAGTRLFWMQPYEVDCRRVNWHEPVAGGWQNPGGEEMILDAGFPSEPADLPRRRDG